MGDEIVESAKAAQEIAKVANNALDKSEKFGMFLNNIFKDGFGIISDKLEYMRWERKIRFAQKVEEINQIRRIHDKTQYVAPKLAIPIIENASMEEDDNLQNLWANLLSSNQDETKNFLNRSSFIDILKQLEFIDASLLKFLYELIGTNDYRDISFKKETILLINKLDENEYENICDNLMRLRLIRSYVVQVKSIMVGNQHTTIDKGYEQICLTSLGINFIKCCILE